MWKWMLLAVPVLLVGVVVVAYGLHGWAAADAESAMKDVAARSEPATRTFDATLLAGLPEIAQRYFMHAIAPGTPLSSTVQIEMEGVFLLGDASQFQSYQMRARQILAPPFEFVWIPEMHSGVMQISGSDGLVRGQAWTRFWINGLIPVVNLQASPDLNRSAMTRSAMEAIWVPASLLPGNGVTWAQTGPNTARLSFAAAAIEPVDLTLDTDGRVVEIVTMRWSDANAERTFRLQPFGGTIEAEATYGGFTIPSEVRMGNHYGTGDYLPFFQARITAANYL